MHKRKGAAPTAPLTITITYNIKANPRVNIMKHSPLLNKGLMGTYEDDNGGAGDD